MSVTAILLAVVLSSAPTADEQAESRFAEARLVVDRHDKAVFRNKGFDDVEGVLVSDTQARRIRFEAEGRTRFEVAYEQLAGLHHGESNYPKTLSRLRSYLTIHYSNAAGEARFEIIRLPRENVPAILAVLERDTGLTIDRQPIFTSFAGLPVHVGIGDTVTITDDTGKSTKGRVTQLSMSSVELQSSGRFDAAAIQKIAVRDSLRNGVNNGTVWIGLPLSYALWNRNYCDDCSILPSFAAGFAIGAVAGALIDRAMSRRAYDKRATAAGRTSSSPPACDPPASHKCAGRSRPLLSPPRAAR